MSLPKALSIWPLKTAVFHAGQDLAKFVITELEKTEFRSQLEESVLAVTCKIVSLAENRLVSRETTDKTSLVKKESDYYLGEVGHGVSLTIKHGLFIPSAGIDESNSENNHFILYPEKPFTSARDLCNAVKKHFRLRNFAVILTDSHTHPLRVGVTGIALSFWGMSPVRNLIGSEDLFGRSFKMTYENHADSLATAAVLMMGEGSECQPLALLKNTPVHFSNDTQYDENPERKIEEIHIQPEKDLYYPVYKDFIQPKN